MSNEMIKRRFTRIRVSLMRSSLFIEMAPVMMLGKKHLDTDTATAATDGYNEWYGEKFCEQLTDEGFGYVIMHENFHKLGRHLVIYKKLSAINHQRTNHACDYWINGKLNKADPTCSLIKMPIITQDMWNDMDKKTQAAITSEGRGVGSILGLYDSKYDNMTIKQIFDILTDEENSGKGDGTGKGGGFDEHDWEAAEDMSDQQIKEMQRDIDDAIRQGIAAAKKAGMTSSNTALGLQELLKPRVNWKAQLNEFIRTTCASKEQSTWRRPKRRYLHEGIILPTMQGHSLRELVLAVDASGSMLGKPLQVVMSEVQGVAQQMSIEKIHLLYWDGAVERHEEYNSTTFKNWQQHTTPRGGGGTTPACVSEYLAEKQIKPDAVVVLTDGEVAGWGQWSVPVLWAIYNPSNTIIAPVGKTISIETN